MSWSTIGDALYAFVHWWTTARVASTAGVIALGAGATSAVVALRSLKQSRADSLARTRPMMTAELKISGKLSANVVIRNGGQSIARNVGVSFDPELPGDRYAADGQGNFGWLILQRYERPVPVWVPGRELENFYWMRDSTSPEDDPRSVDGMPARAVVTIHYSDDAGRSYSDAFPLDIRELTGAALPIETTRHTSTSRIGGTSLPARDQE